MRLNRTILAILTLTLLTLALTSPAAAQRNCKPIEATLGTSAVDEYVEIGEVEGAIEGAAYLRYDDAAPPIDPAWERPNLVITNQAGDINLWVYSKDKPDGADTWWRQFEVLRVQGTGIYANRRIILEIYGKCSVKGGSYEIEGMICAPFVLPPKK